MPDTEGQLQSARDTDDHIKFNLHHRLPRKYMSKKTCSCRLLSLFCDAHVAVILIYSQVSYLVARKDVFL
jgi:hypothetical protein